MSTRIEDIKKKLLAVVSDANTGEVQQAVSLNDTKVGTASSPKSLEVTDDLAVRGSLKGGSAAVPALAGGRLSLTSSTPITAVDVSEASTVYYTPFETGQITLWTGSEWEMFWFDEISFTPDFSLLTSSTNYDVFAYAVGDQVFLELGPAWSGNNTRSSGVTYFRGILCLTVDPTRRYIGTLRTTSSNRLEDSTARRFIWNFYHQRRRHMSVVEATSSWTFATTINVWRQVRQSAANKFEYVCGQPVELEASGALSANGNAVGIIFGPGVGIDSTNVNSAQIFNASITASGTWGFATCQYRGVPSLGYHAINWLETSNWGPTGTMTMISDFSGGANSQKTGLVGTVYG